MQYIHDSSHQQQNEIFNKNLIDNGAGRGIDYNSFERGRRICFQKYRTHFQLIFNRLHKQKRTTLRNEKACQTSRPSLHTLKTLHNNHTHIKIPAGTVRQASGLTGTELAPRGTGDALVPTYICKLSHHLVHHCSFLLLLHSKHTVVFKIKKINHQRLKYTDGESNKPAAATGIA